MKLLKLIFSSALFIFTIIFLTSSTKVFAATFVNDTFTDTAGVALTSHTGATGATWAKNGALSGSSIIVSDANRIRSNISGDSIYYASGSPINADYSVTADVYVASATGSVGVIGRSSTSALTYYLFDREAGNIKLYTVVNGAVVGTTGSAVWTPTVGATYAFKLSMVGSTITAYIDGVQVLQKTDSNITSAGKGGVYLSGASTNSTAFHIDTFSASDVVPNATTFSFSGPTIGGNGFASSNFTITPDGPYTGTITITPSGGGLSTPIVLTFSNSSTPQTFTITPTSLGVVTLTPTNNGGLTNPAPLNYTSTTDSGVVAVGAGDLWENGYDNVANPRQSALSFVRLSTDATILRVTGTTTNHNATPTGFDVLGLRINGVDQSQIIFPANGSYTTNDIPMSAGAKTIDIITGSQNHPPASQILGTFIDSFELLGYTSYSVVTPTTTGRLLVYGDSISVGYSDSVNRGQKGWTSLVRNAGRKLMNEGYGYRALKDDAVDSSARTAFVSRISGYAPNVIWIAMGVNDYFNATWSATSFGTAYAALLDGLHAALPTTTIYCQTPTVQGTETANGLGDTLGAFRTQISTVCGARPWTTLIDGTTIYAPSDISGDNIHPTTAGHAKYANFVEPYVAIDGGVSVSLSAPSGVLGSSVTATLTRALGSTFLSGDQMTIDWGDSTTSTVTPTVGATTGAASHTYLTEGNHTITITNNRNWPNPSSTSYLTFSSAALITSFNLASPLATGTINNTNHTVTLTVPYGTNVTSLIPTIAVSSGATISPLSGIAGNFTSPQTYTVTAQNGTTTQTYTVTVSVLPNTNPPVTTHNSGGGLLIYLQNQNNIPQNNTIPVNTNTNPTDTSSIYGSKTSVVRINSRGTSAENVQRAINQMNATNPALVVDGIIGRKSVLGIMAVQRILGVKADGIWGKNTQKLYEEMLTRF